jgi:hypothetical protein
MEPIGIEEYRKMQEAKKKMKKLNEKIVVQDPPPPTQHRGGGKSDKLTTRQALHQMAIFFEIDEKKAKFFITQLELNGKI